MGCKFTGRTVVLVVVVLQLCALYCAVYETISAALKEDKTTVANGQEFGRFFVIYSAIELLAICGGAALIITSVLKSLAWRKSLVILVLGLNWILILPINISGLHLFLASQNTTTLNQSSRLIFNNFLHKSQNNDSNLPRELASIQEENCCCGLKSHFDYLPKSSNTTAFCPNIKSCRYRNGNFLGCEEELARKMRNLTLVAASIGGICSLIAIGITPFVYAYFEKDRREARANAIRMWRSAVQQVIEKKQQEMMKENSSSKSASLSSTRSS